MNFQFPAYPYASCQGGLVYMPHVRHSIQWVCNPVPVATLKAQARGLLQQVWSRKNHLRRLGRIGVRAIGVAIIGRILLVVGSGDLSISLWSGKSTTSEQLLTLEFCWILSVPYLCGQSTKYIYICMYYTYVQVYVQYIPSPLWYYVYTIYLEWMILIWPHLQVCQWYIYIYTYT